MQWLNTQQRYGIINIAFHWFSALLVIALFALGLWMEDLDYNHPWYRTAPDLHRSFGVLLVTITLLRLVWRQFNILPATPVNHKLWEKRLAKLFHWLFYILIILMFISGYFITTAKGQGVTVFNLFTIPATGLNFANMEDIAGEIHEIIAFSLIGLASIHALAALKHHYWDKDVTLKRMLGRV